MIGLLAVLTLAELRAQYAFNQSLAICQEALNRSEGAAGHMAKKVLFADLKNRFASEPSHRVGVHQFAKVEIYSWSWQGLRRYSLRLYVDSRSGAVIDTASAVTWTAPGQAVPAKSFE